MLVQVIPIKRLPLKKTVFDYLVEQEMSGRIKIGQLVRIPFRNSIEFGIVRAVNSFSKTTVTLKNIIEIVFNEPFLNREQLNFLEEIAEIYRAPLSFLLKTNLLPLQKRKLKKISIKKQAERTARQFERPNVFIYSTNEEKQKYLKIKLPGGGQNLILVPEIHQIKTIVRQLPVAVQKNVLIVTGELSDKEMFDLWLKIRNEPRITVVGTRRALFLPWTNLTAIFLDDEGNPDYKSWDMAPRFHTREASIVLAKQHAAKIYLLTHTPSVETYYFAEHGVYNPEHINLQPFRHPFRLIDLKQERRGKNYGLLNEDLISDLETMTSGDAFLFINRRGDAGCIFCRDCGLILKCTRCHRPLTYYKQKENLCCHYCRTEQLMPNNCNQCGNATLTPIGLGASGIENELKKINRLKKFKIIRLDSKSNAPVEELNNPQSKIIVGTEYAWARIDWPKIKVLGVLDADLSLLIPEYKAPEHLWQGLRASQFRLTAGAKIYIQTNYPEHPVFQALYHPKQFYQEQLKERKLFQYPPYNFLLKLFYGNASATAAAANGQKIYNQLLALTQDKNRIKISCSLESNPRFYRQQYWRIILIKIGYEHYKQNIKLINQELPDNWKVDPNPNSLLSLN